MKNGLFLLFWILLFSNVYIYCAADTKKNELHKLLINTTQGGHGPTVGSLIALKADVNACDQNGADVNGSTGGNIIEDIVVFPTEESQHKRAALIGEKVPSLFLGRATILDRLDKMVVNAVSNNHGVNLILLSDFFDLPVEGLTPLCIAALKGSQETVQFLLKANAQVNQGVVVPIFKNQKTVPDLMRRLHKRIIQGQRRYIAQIDQSAVKPIKDIVMVDRITPVCIAALKGYVEIVSLLVAADADISPVILSEIIAKELSVRKRVRGSLEENINRSERFVLMLGMLLDRYFRQLHCEHVRIIADNEFMPADIAALPVERNGFLAVLSDDIIFAHIMRYVPPQDLARFRESSRWFRVLACDERSDQMMRNHVHTKFNAMIKNLLSEKDGLAESDHKKELPEVVEILQKNLKEEYGTKV